MELPPEPKTKYVFDNEQDKRIFAKLGKFEILALNQEQEEVVKFLYSQLETNWRDPFEAFADEFLEKKVSKK